MEITLSSVSYSDCLGDINYTFQDGKITAIMGKSGSGKSLLGFIIMGLLKQDSGSVLVDGISNFDRYKFYKNVGYVFENPKYHFVGSTVYEEISFAIKQFKYKLDNINSRVVSALKMVGLSEDFLDRKINTLSSGEVVRVAIASVLVLNPKVLIFDDVFGYMDNGFKREFISLVLKLKERYGKTIIIMSNDVSFIYEVCDNYLLLDDGRVISSGDAMKFFCDEYDYGVDVPCLVRFVRLARKRYNVSLEYTNNIDDLVMDVCSYEK